MQPILVFLAIVLPSIAFSQTNYTVAYAIKNNGDTLKGYMDYREWRETPKSIDFKQTPTSKEIIKLYPGDIKYVGFKGLDSYMSYSGLLSTDKNSYPDLLNRLDTTVTNDVVFLKVVIPGQKVSLLLNRDEIKIRLFFKETGASPQELKYHQYYNDAGDKILTSDGYRKQLAYLINKYSPNNGKLYAQLQNQYDLDNIEKIILDINGMAAASATKLSAVKYFIGLGANYITTTFAGPPSFGFSSKSSSILPVVNVGFDFLSNPNFQSSFFRAAISLSAISPTFSSVSSDFKFTQYSIGLSPQYIFNIYNTDKLKYFVGGGLSINYAFYTSKLIVNESGVVINQGTIQNLGDSYQSHSKGDVINDPYDLSVVWFYLTVKTGIVLNKKVEIYAIFNPAAISYCSSYSTSAKNQSFGAGINFLFGK